MITAWISKKLQERRVRKSLNYWREISWIVTHCRFEYVFNTNELIEWLKSREKPEGTPRTVYYIPTHDPLSGVISLAYNFERFEGTDINGFPRIAVFKAVSRKNNRTPEYHYVNLDDLRILCNAVYIRGA
jgi:hypothetical protein